MLDETSSMSFNYNDATSIDHIYMDSPLIGTSWTALAVPENIAPVRPITLEIGFVEDSITGDAGCNRYRGFGAIYEDKIEIGELFSQTKMVCLEPGIMEQETNYIAFLQSSNVLFYEIVDEELIFYESIAGQEDGELTKGGMVARFVKDATPL